MLRTNASVKNPSDERQNKIFKDKRDQYLAKIASLDQQISSTEDDLKFVKEQLDIQKQLENSKKELFELDLVAESQVLAERNKRLSLEKNILKQVISLVSLNQTEKNTIVSFLEELVMN